MQNKNIIKIKNQLKKHLSKRLKELRKKNKYSQKFVANSIGISYKTYQSYENGRTLPNLKTAIKFSEFFNVSLNYLLQK